MRQSSRRSCLTMENSAIILLLLCLLASPASSQTADIEVRVLEEEPEGTFVANVSAYGSLFQDVAPENRFRLEFAILDKASFPASLFKIDASTGVISMARRLDREYICDTTNDCFVEFNVAIQGTQDLSFSNVASVKVIVDDVNDNSPNFPADQVFLEISEGAKVGTVLKLSGPQDLDSLPNNTIQRYESTLTDGVFTVSATKNPDGTSIINLRLEEVLDRETVEEYNFNIIAYDGGDPPRSDFLKVSIQVTDENDNAPVFQNHSYVVDIREDMEVGSEVVQIQALDKDAGEFGLVQYRFSSLRSEVIDRVFAINSSTGVISLKSRPQTGDSQYKLVVEAFDGGNPPSVVQKVVTINVLNTGNNRPIVRIVTVEGESSEIQLPESATKDAFVAFVNVEDTDEGENGDVTCAMRTTAQFRLEELRNKGYKVLLNLPIDREIVPAYTATIVCNDNGTPPMTTETTFKVIITDVNDNSPVFGLVGFAATVDENNAVGQYLLQVTASDRDTGNNAVITYGFLEPEATNWLSVHPQTGVVTAAVNLDRETTPVLRYTLTAVDGGETALTGTARLTVTVRDVNDNYPQLLHTPYRYNVTEAAETDHVVGVMVAEDADGERNGEVEFFFAGSVSGDIPFTVLRNGTITVSGVLDRETADTHVFTVLARDRGSIPKSNSTQVIIKVTDINDNLPVILFPTNANHSVVITTPPEQGIVLGRVIAYDADEGDASSLVYSIHSGDDDAVFAIDPETGRISLKALERLKNPYVYELVLRVSDNGDPPLNSTTHLQVEVNFPNASFSGSHEDRTRAEAEQSRDSYVIIVGVIGGATLVLSGIIIGAILFVLRSERQRKARDNEMFKNDYSPPKAGVPYDDDTKIPKSPSSMKSSQSDLSSNGVILSPKGLPQKPDVQKKVSFSFDEPDAEVRQIQSRETSASLPPPVVFPEADAGGMWKRLVSPDDINSDTSGESATSDSGKGASDDDIHLDTSLDKHAGTHAPHYVNTANLRQQAADPYKPPAFTVGPFRQGQHQGQGQHHQGQRSSASRPRFLHTGSYHEGRSDNFRKQQPRYHNQYPQQRYQPVSLHPEAPPRRQSGSRHSLDFVENRNYGLPPRPASSMSYQRQGSAMSVDDDASTTTSGSYTISPDELRLDGLVSPDVIV
nr:hypothetical protein BaRGS_018025 [Batillaria attramentaria]